MVKAIGPSSEKTRSAILDLIRSNGTVSRIELVEQSGLTAASITRIVKSLLADGLVVETGFGTSTGGKRPTLLELNTSARYAVGLALDETRLTYVVTDIGGSLVGRVASPGIGKLAPAEVLPRIANEVDALLEQLEIARADVVGLGVAGAGLDFTSRADADAPTEEWETFRLQDALEHETGFAVVRENDAACAALGQFWVGRVPATQDFATLYMANGFGCGLVIRGSLFRGASSNVGEIGHMVVEEDGPPCWCGSRGCLEMLAAPKRIVRDAFDIPGLATSLELHGGEAEVRRDFAVIAREAVRGDERCLALIERSARFLAKALLSVVNLLDLDRLYLAGPGFADAGAIYARAISDELRRYARTRTLHGVAVELSDAVLETAAIGAAAVALQHALTPHARPAAITPLRPAEEVPSAAH
jgi:predicted NBD/HSP70 family sugar kinase